ncbi:MAG: putative DNA binding domain-containing protein [Bacteroidales bacterium]|nr:putative DNA binding domain-containing protein [Bacteroidales bacterium]
MTPAQLQTKLTELLALPQETEWAEFKHNNTNPQMIGANLSALSNAATLEGQPFGYIVWGVEDGTRNIIGTTFQPRRQKVGNEDLEPWLNKLLSPKVNFRILEFEAGGLPMVMFEIQAANTAPVAFSGDHWVRVGSHKKPLSEHPERERKLWLQLSGPIQDWSAQICVGATLNDLDPTAITFARQEYKKKHPTLAAEADGWDDMTFLNKAKVCINGQITRTAIILLGRAEATHHLAPCLPQISWILQDEHGLEQDYYHFEPPFLSAVDGLFARVRNLTIRHLPDGTLFPIEVTQYDPWVLRETLHNCIAHQDYTPGGRIHVVEQPGSLLFTNRGRFIPGSVEVVITRDAPQEVHTNPFLTRAMVHLNMIDTIGSGIKRMFTKQRQRNFPMPDYDLGEAERVKVRVVGQVIDDKYTRMLMARTDLDLLDVIALDKVQKRVPLSEDEFQSLKSKNLIEGRRPNLSISADVAKATDTMVDYLKKRGVDKEYCQRMVMELLQKQGQANRQDIDKLLLAKLSDALDDKQKRNFIKNLLQEMRRNQEMDVEGKGPAAVWKLSKPSEKDGG